MWAVRKDLIRLSCNKGTNGIPTESMNFITIAISAKLGTIAFLPNSRFIYFYYWAIILHVIWRGCLQEEAWFTISKTNILGCLVS